MEKMDVENDRLTFEVTSKDYEMQQLTLALEEEMKREERRGEERGERRGEQEEQDQRVASKRKERLENEEEEQRERDEEISRQLTVYVNETEKRAKLLRAEKASMEKKLREYESVMMAQQEHQQLQMNMIRTLRNRTKMLTSQVAFERSMRKNPPAKSKGQAKLREQFAAQQHLVSLQKYQNKTETSRRRQERAWSLLNR